MLRSYFQRFKHSLTTKISAFLGHMAIRRLVPERWLPKAARQISIEKQEHIVQDIEVERKNAAIEIPTPVLQQTPAEAKIHEPDIIRDLKTEGKRPQIKRDTILYIPAKPRVCTRPSCSLEHFSGHLLFSQSGVDIHIKAVAAPPPDGMVKVLSMMKESVNQ